MKSLIATTLSFLILSFVVQGQSVMFSTTAQGNNGIELQVEVTATDVIVTQNNGGCTVKVQYDTDVKFYQNGNEMHSGYPSIWTLQGDFKVDGKSSFFNITNSVGQEYNKLSSTYSINGLAACATYSMLTADFEKIKLKVQFQGHNKTIHVNGSTSNLPIELLSFDANLNQKQVDLSWSTASELNNDYFTIERSADGMTWETIQTIEGAGNSTRVIDYNYTDYSPVSGISYYRLTQTDFDGAFETFDILAVENNTLIEMNAFPNPSTGFTTISGLDENSDLRIFNAMGAEVTSKVSITKLGSISKLDITQLTEGLYFVHSGENSLRLVKK
ncbi:T9SS type A sorting domain-containing protein [Brumimicrobium aurantiacum]|nr:T9SS type A sorting domain-containing protein [Brumimicrobium aurantiacum]